MKNMQGLRIKKSNAVITQNSLKKIDFYQLIADNRSGKSGMKNYRTKSLKKIFLFCIPVPLLMILLLDCSWASGSRSKMDAAYKIRPEKYSLTGHDTQISLEISWKNNLAPYNDQDYANWKNVYSRKNEDSIIYILELNDPGKITSWNTLTADVKNSNKIAVYFSIDTRQADWKILEDTGNAIKSRGYMVKGSWHHSNKPDHNLSDGDFWHFKSTFTLDNADFDPGSIVLVYMPPDLDYGCPPDYVFNKSDISENQYLFTGLTYFYYIN